MKEKEMTIEQAAADIAEVRKSLTEADAHHGTARQDAAPTTTGAHIILQAGALILAVWGLGSEVLSGHQNSALFLASVGIPDIQVIGLVQIFAILSIIVAGIYLMAHRAAKRSRQNFGEYVSRHFPYLKHQSFVSDLVLKFCVIGMVILADKPALVAPICMMFVGDYLIQGRFFTIPLIVANVLGGAAMLGGVAMFLLGSTLLAWPFAAVAIAAAYSLSQMIYLRRSSEQLQKKVAA